MANFAVRMVHLANWDESRSIRDQAAWIEHASFMDALVDEGFILLGGPLGNGESAMHLIEANDANEVEARLGEDPWANMGMLGIGLIERWRLWLDGRTTSEHH